MLKDSAEMLVELDEELLKFKLFNSDPNPFNILFDGTDPIFLDFRSIEEIKKKKKSYYYKIYTYFLIPILLTTRGQENIARLFLKNDVCTRIPYNLNKLNLNTQTKIEYIKSCFLKYLTSPFSGRFFKNYKNSKKDSSDISLDQIKHNIRTLKVISKENYLIKRINEKKDFSLIPSKSWSEKQSTVFKVLNNIKPKTVIDICCGNGWYSMLAASMGSKVVAFDNSNDSIDEMYTAAKNMRLNILPLVIDIMNPSPDLGFDNSIESAKKRLQCEMAFLLNKLQYLVFHENIDFKRLVNVLSKYTTKYLLVEFVIIENVEYRNASRERYSFYNLENFNDELLKYYKKVTILPHSPNSNVLILCEYKI